MSVWTVCPATHLQKYSQDEIYTIVRDIYNSTIFSDIVKRNQVRKIDQLERVVKYTFQNVSNTFSAKSISDYLKSERRALDNETVYSYLEKLEKAYLLHRCSRYDLQGKEILKRRKNRNTIVCSKYTTTTPEYVLRADWALKSSETALKISNGDIICQVQHRDQNCNLKSGKLRMKSVVPLMNGF